MLKLKLQYFGHLIWRADSFEKTLILGRIEGGGRRDDRGLDGWVASLTLWTWVWASSRSWWWTGNPGVGLSMGSQRVEHAWVTELMIQQSHFQVFLQRKQKHYLKEIYVLPCAGLCTTAKTWRQPQGPPTEEQAEKMWYTHTHRENVIYHKQKTYYYLWKYGWTLRVLEASLVAQRVKNLPAVLETRVRSLGRGELLEEGMAIHCSILA